jgi:DNA-binding IclR family transcriptional regulator
MIGEAVSSGPLEAWPVARTMQALEALAFQPLSAPQVAAVLQIHPRTARRLLTRLLEEGYVARSDDGRRLYSPTMRLVALAGQIVERARLATTAAPFVARLHEATGGDAHLVVPSYRSALCIVHAGADGGPVEPGINELLPAHCAAPGKAMLAHRLPWRDSILRTPLHPCTERTVLEPAAVRAESVLTQQRGYAAEDGEHRAGVRGAAAPVFGAGGDALAAMGVSTAAPVPVEALALEVVPIARELTGALGG